MWQDGLWLAAIWEARGVLRRSEGDHPQAAALFKEAAEQSPRRTGPSTRPGAEPRPPPPPDLDGHPDRPIGRFGVRDPTAWGPLELSAEENTFS
jgi:hypothetical protein